MAQTNPTFSTASCPACAGTSFVKRFVKKGRYFWRCSTCGLERIDPPPSLTELEAYYNQSYESGLYNLFLQENHMKQLTAEHRLKSILPYAGEGRWLDLGCANGVLVEAALKAGYDAEGIDLSSRAVESGRSKGLSLHVATIEDGAPDTSIRRLLGLTFWNMSLIHWGSYSMYNACWHRAVR